MEGMAFADPLARPVWSMLTGRQSHLAFVEGGARRLDPDYGVFAGLQDASAESLAGLAKLVRAHGIAALVEPDDPPAVPGTTTSRAVIWQMVGERDPGVPTPDFEIIPLSEADGAEMLALATLTRPGPFNRRTHELGVFVGVRYGGRLVAMAGERMKLDGHTEVSGVCTHPDWRGRGYATGLMRHVAAQIRARGETPFLHVYPDNTGAIALYEALGYAKRRELVMTSLSA